MFHDLKAHQIELETQNEELRRAQFELEAARKRYSDLYDLEPVGYFTLSDKGLILEADLTAAKLLGAERSSLIKQPLTRFILPEDQDIFCRHHKRFVETGAPQTCEMRMLRPNAAPFWAQMQAAAGQAADGSPLCRAVVSDITERKKADNLLMLSDQVLHQLNQTQDPKHTIHDILDLIQMRSGFEAVGIRLCKGEDFPYYETKGFSEDFVLAERFLCERDEAGGIVRDEAGNPMLECMCGNILRGRFDPKLPFFTEKGSFWTNSTTRLLASTTGKDPQGRIRSRCNKAGYESVALIPLRSDDEIIGLLQLNDRRPDRCSPELIRFFEGLGSGIGVALSRMRMVECLRASEERHRAIVSSLHEGIILQGSNGRILTWNAAAERILGISAEAVIGRTSSSRDWEILREDGSEFPGAEHPSVQTLRTGRPRKNVVIGVRNAAGRLLWINVSTSPLFKEGEAAPYAVAISVADITERRRSEQKIEHLNRVLRAIRNVNQLITREKNPEKLVLESSKLLVEQWGYGCAMIILTDAAGNPRRHAQAGCGQAFEPMAESLRQGMLPPCCAEARSGKEIYRVKDRARVCAPCPMAAHCARSSTLCIPLRHEGALHGYLVVAVDHAIEIDAEEQSLLTEVAGDLAFALHGIGQEAAIQKSEEMRRVVEGQLRHSQKMEVVGRLAGGVAHDFNNILTAILGNCGFLMNGISKNDPLRADVEEIRGAGERAANLTRQLLAFSRKQVMQLLVIDLNGVLTDTEKLLRRLIGEDIVLAVSRAEKPALVKSDSGQMEQVVMNLAVNARDAMPKGGRLSIETRGVDVPASHPLGHDDAMPPGRYVLLSVSDTGTGMDATALEHIFEPFFTTNELGKGTGLGLATVYGIVKQSNGFIDVQSEPGRGTTFKIFLPASQEVRREGEVEGEGEKIQRRVRKRLYTILLIEDDQTVRRMACRILKSAGYAVLETGSAREALAHADKDFDLVLTDIVLPDLSGAELEAKLNKGRPRIEAIFMSGYADNLDIRDILSHPEKHFLQKPFTAMALLNKIQDVLGG
ncbi:MAG: PAS domain S-box protein [Elusimicrobia bacterium]|nr:PAS domain S-box protein [Elusimicrobiota bacterium]